MNEIVIALFLQICLVFRIAYLICSSTCTFIFVNFILFLIVINLFLQMAMVQGRGHGGDNGPPDDDRPWQPPPTT